MAGKRDIISINDISNSEIEEIFQLADQYCESMASPETPHQIRGRRSDANDFIIATLFYEPSTRTRFSFESAMLRLGGNVLASADPGTTSASKGESLADTVRVIENYADLIILRHSREGAARAAAEYVGIPIINGGDGSHEHPTQTLCDLYTLRRENKSIEGLNVLLVGDLKNGRTVHSLVYALARFGANILTMPGDGLELPNEVASRLQEEFGCRPVPREAVEELLDDSASEPPVGAVYVAPSGGRQLSLLKEENFDLKSVQGRRMKKIDVCYVTRLQGERISAEDLKIGRYPVVNTKFLRERRYSEATVLHPLPRVSELGYELDRDPRGAWFRQAGYGVPVRMAIIAKVLGITPFKSHSVHAPRPVYESAGGLLCPNPNCITHNESEQRYLSPKAMLARPAPPLFRCLYCETTIPVRFVGHKESRTYRALSEVGRIDDLKNIVLFSDQDPPGPQFQPDRDSSRRIRAHAQPK